MADDRRDVLDEELAVRFLELMAESGAELTPEELDEALADRIAGRPSRLAGRARFGLDRPVVSTLQDPFAALRDSVQRVWTLAGEAQAGATRRLFRQATEAGLDCAVFAHSYPQAAVRLFRLVIRHYRQLPRKSRRYTAFLCAWQDASRQPEATEMLCEAARSGDSWLAYLAEQAVLNRNVGALQPELGRRLAQILDGGSLKAAGFVVFWLGYGDWPEARPALRRALRRNVLRLRWAALHTLLEYPVPQLGEDDLLFLLEDAVVHPPLPIIGRRRRAAWEEANGYETELLRAVRTLRPSGGEKPLLRIARGDCTYIQRDREFLGEGWALSALTAAYPEVALPLIDQRLKANEWWVRRRAIEAAARLPEGLARPRLRMAVADPRPELAELAQAKWHVVTGEYYRLDLREGLCAELLPAQLSAVAEARLIVLRRPEAAPRQQLIVALLAEAPNRESLALLLFALGDESLLYRPPPELELPGLDDWAGVIADRFGEAGVDGLLWLADRFRGWIGKLAKVADHAVTTPEQRERMRAVAARALAAPEGTERLEPYLLLRELGAPVELLERLWEVAFGWADGPHVMAFWARDLVVGLARRFPGVNGQLLEAFSRALAADEVERAVLLAAAALATGATGSRERVLLALEELEAQGAADALHQLASELRHVGALPEGWAREGLHEPVGVRTVAACCLLTGKDLANDGVLAAVDRLSVSEALEGRVAVAAVHRLFWSGAIEADDPRVGAALRHADVEAREPLVGALCLKQGRATPPEVLLQRLRPYFVKGLCSPVERVARRYFDFIYMHRFEGHKELLEEVYEDLAIDKLRDTIDAMLRRPNRAERYWAPQPRDERDDDEEDEEW